MEGSVWKRTKFQDGLYNGIGIAIGYIPAALTFGLLAKSASLSLMETMSLSVFVYAGASQNMALNLIVIGTGTFEIVAAAFFIAFTGVNIIFTVLGSIGILTILSLL